MKQIFMDDDIQRWLKPGWYDYAVAARHCGKPLYRAHKFVENIVEKENNMINKNCESYDKCMHVRGRGSCDGCGNMFNGIFDEAFKKYVQHDIDTLVKTHGYATFKKPSNPFAIKNVIFNPPATIVFWEDGTKTVVKAGEHDEFDPEKGLAMAISKKALGNKGSYFNEFKKWCGKYDVEPLYPNVISNVFDDIKVTKEAWHTYLKKYIELHKNYKPIGKVEKIEVTDEGLRAEINTEGCAPMEVFE